MSSSPAPSDRDEGVAAYTDAEWIRWLEARNGELLTEVERLRDALNEIIDMPIDEAKSAGFHFAEVRRIAREAMLRET